MAVEGDHQHQEDEPGEKGRLILPTTISRESNQQSGSRQNRRRFPGSRTQQQHPPPPTPSTRRSFQKNDETLPAHVLNGLTLAGIAQTILTTLFTLLSSTAQQQQQQQQHPIFPSYPWRVVLLTVAPVLGAWWFDQKTAASASRRSDWIGVAGLSLTATFVVSWLVAQYNSSSSTLQWIPYEAAFAVFTIILASTATDDHRMPYKARIWFMMSSEMGNLLATVVVTGIALFLEFGASTVARTDHSIVLLLVWVAFWMFVAAQNMIFRGGDYSSRRRGALTRLLSLRSMVPLKRKEHDEDDNDLAAGQHHQQQQPKRRVQLRNVIRSVAQSPNYRAWIGMEMLLEAQVFFQTAFLPTLMLRLAGVSYVHTEAAVAVIKPLRQLGSILTYIPMRRFGYARVYTFLFYFNLLLSILAFFFGDPSSKARVYIVLFAFPIVSGAVLSSGFQFAMADLSLEVKYAHTTSRTGTSTEPSVAALLLGINTIFCKPVKYLFSVMAQNILHNESGSPTDAFHLLIATPMICSCLQLIFWRKYGLTPERVSSMRDELQRALDDDGRSSSDRLSAGV